MRTVVPGYFTVSEAAEQLGIGISGVHRYIDLGRLPAVNLGRQMLIPAAAIKKFQPRPPGRPPNSKPGK